MSHATPSLPKVASLWIGSELGLIEQLTIQSFLAHGHSFTLFTTEEVQGIPAGTVVRNANEIFPCQHIVRDYKTSSPAIHADMFRYAMLAKTELMWVDMDVLCLRPFYPNSPYVFAFEDENTINNAVLRLPKDSPTLAALLAYKPETKGYPPFFSTGRKIRYWLKNGGKKPSINKWPWGSIGPKGLSYHLRQNKEINHAQNQEAFYSLRCSEIGQVLDPYSPFAAGNFPTGAYYLHLWGKFLRDEIKKRGIPPNSFLAKQAQHLSVILGHS